MADGAGGIRNEGGGPRDGGRDIGTIGGSRRNGRRRVFGELSEGGGRKRAEDCRGVRARFGHVAREEEDKVRAMDRW